MSDVSNFWCGLDWHQIPFRHSERNPKGAGDVPLSLRFAAVSHLAWNGKPVILGQHRLTDYEIIHQLWAFRRGFWPYPSFAIF